MISVVIPTCDRVELLSGCLNSIVSRNQCVEIIVTDDSPHFTSKRLRAEFPLVKFVRGPRRGLPANRNNGISFATNPYVAFIDDDCLATASWLAAYQDAIVAHPGARFFGGAVIEDRPRSRVDEEAPRLESGATFHGCNFMVCREALGKIGGFNERFFFLLEDIEAATRARKAGFEIAFVSNAAVVHPWRVIPSLRRKFVEAHAYRDLLREHPELSSVMGPWTLFKIAVGHSRRYYQLVKECRGVGAIRGGILVVVSYYKIVSVGSLALIVRHRAQAAVTRR